jgi:hypothetical protein
LHCTRLLLTQSGQSANTSSVLVWSPPLSLGEAMRRREFISFLGGAATAWPLGAHAQQFGKMPRVGVLVTLSAPHPFSEALRSGMGDLGYIEGHNIAFEWRYADAQFSRAVEFAALKA